MIPFLSEVEALSRTTPWSYDDCAMILGVIGDRDDKDQIIAFMLRAGLSARSILALSGALKDK